jgi:hypothetical protein
MPTYHAAHHLEVLGRALPASAPAGASRKAVVGLGILEAGRLKTTVAEILEIIAAHDVALATGHLSCDEIVVLAKEALAAGIRRVLVTHAEVYCPQMPVSLQQELASQGIYIEHSFGACMPDYQARFPCTVETLVAGIRASRPERSIITTDFGQLFNPHPIEGMRIYIQTLLRYGFTTGEIDRMVKQNPAALLSLT